MIVILYIYLYYNILNPFDYCLNENLNTNIAHHTRRAPEKLIPQVHPALGHYSRTQRGWKSRPAYKKRVCEHDENGPCLGEICPNFGILVRVCRGSACVLVKTRAKKSRVHRHKKRPRKPD